MGTLYHGRKVLWHMVLERHAPPPPGASIVLPPKDSHSLPKEHHYLSVIIPFLQGPTDKRFIIIIIKKSNKQNTQANERARVQQNQEAKLSQGECDSGAFSGPPRWSLSGPSSPDSLWEVWQLLLTPLGTLGPSCCAAKSTSHMDRPSACLANSLAAMPAASLCPCQPWEGGTETAPPSQMPRWTQPQPTSHETKNWPHSPQ